MSDPGLTYRSREEVSDIRKHHDCIDLVRKLLLENKLSTE
jgi:pyruvate dehydrogenase E1 component alpha subunit